MIYYGMVNTASSSAYTSPALRSFFRHTELGPSDRFFLIDNDGGYEVPAGFDRVEVIRNPQPQSFARNVNAIIRRAAEVGADVIFPNNDVIFGPGWLEPLMARDDAILIPLCNQFQLYSLDDFALQPTMDLADFEGREAQFDEMVRRHQTECVTHKYVGASHISFFCFRIPRRIYAALGLFDENFGRGGGEDVDYRIRAHLAGFDVCMAAESFLLHFMGKSTWRGGEAAEQTQTRNEAYLSYFRQKWGEDLARVFLFTGDWRTAIAQLGVQQMIDGGDYLGAIRQLLSRRC